MRKGQSRRHRFREPSTESWVVRVLGLYVYVRPKAGLQEGWGQGQGQCQESLYLPCRLVSIEPSQTTFLTQLVLFYIVERHIFLWNFPSVVAFWWGGGFSSPRLYSIFIFIFCMILSLFLSSLCNLLRSLHCILFSIQSTHFDLFYGMTFSLLSNLLPIYFLASSPLRPSMGL